MSKATKFRKIRDGMTAAVAALGATSLIAGFMVLGTAGAAQANNGNAGQSQTSGSQVWVCKYTGQRGEEVLAPGKNPIAVNADRQPGEFFSDAQGPSYVLDFVTAENTAQGNTYSGELVCPVSQPPQPEAPTPATAVAPSVTQSPACEVEGSYTIPSTEGVRYLLGGQPVTAGTYSGPATGTVTAEALEGYELTNPSFSFALDVAAADECDDEEEPTSATAVAPSVTQSPECDVEGSYTIPSTAGVRYLLDGVAVEAGTYSGPKSGVITAEALEGYELTNEGFTFSLSIAAAEKCDEQPPVVPPPPPVNPPVVEPPVVEPPVVEPPVVTPPTTDVCTNIPGAQASVPLGYTAVDGICTKDDVAGEDAEAPEPSKTDKPKVQPAADEVLGEEAVPTAVAAGIGGPTGSVSAPGSLLGQGLIAGGLMMLLLAGSAQMGRRQRGAHEH